LFSGRPQRPHRNNQRDSARTDADFAFRAELIDLARRRGIRLFLLPGPRASADSWAPAGHPDDVRLLGHLVPDLTRQDVYICGPDAWMAAVRRAAEALGVPTDHLHTEQFSW
jgi:ferredoxin-NADP reductase